MTTEIDLNAIEAEVNDAVGEMTPEQVQEELLKLRVKQKVAQKKYQNPERQKAYQAKVKARRNALIARAREEGYYDQVNDAAADRADEILAEQEASSEDE